jgi:hypothetical protein
MNTSWLTLPNERRIETLNQATELTGLPAIAIEKDWWVTLCLNASFSLPYSENIVFKGGTSLGKGLANKMAILYFAFCILYILYFIFAPLFWKAKQ